MDELASELLDMSVGTTLALAVCMDLLCETETISRHRLLSALSRKSAEIRDRATDSQAFAMAQLEACLRHEAAH